MRRIMTTLVGLLLMTIVASACSSTGVAVSPVSPADAAAVIAAGSNVVVLDIRTPQEFNEGIIEGAINIDFYESSFAATLDTLDKDAEYVVYCRSGNRSSQARKTFESLGFTNVTEIEGGIVDWYASGLPVVAP